MIKVNVEDSVLESYSRTNIPHGLILQISPEDFAKLLHSISTELPDAYVVYQTHSLGRLYIKRGEPDTT
ncbi:MAG: hypothetical protein WC325_12780 [Candidatus Bathyarchaeia archaeon]|jgi:hypothetical protein